MSGNVNLNNWIRRQAGRRVALQDDSAVEASAVEAQAAPGIPQGHAGAGTGSIMPGRELTMNDYIRVVAKGWWI
jgi:hypothetical protein